MDVAQMLAGNIKRLSTDYGISINKLLLECGINTSFVTDLKKGQMPSADKLVKIAKYFNVSTDYLLGLTEEPSPKELVLPDELRGMRVAFHGGAFDGLDEADLDMLKEMAKMLKSKKVK